MVKDMAKAFRHCEVAAMGGHVLARHNLGSAEYYAGNHDLALQHWMIAAPLGQEGTLNNVKILFNKGLATKADYAAALRGYQNAVQEMSSPDRDEAKALGAERTHAAISIKVGRGRQMQWKRVEASVA